MPRYTYNKFCILLVRTHACYTFLYSSRKIPDNDMCVDITQMLTTE